MKHPILTWKRRRHLRSYPDHIRQVLLNPDNVTRLKATVRIVCTDTSMFYNPFPRVTEFFATQDQTEQSRYKVIQLCGSLALCGHTPHFTSIHKSAASLGVALREVEVEVVQEFRIYGKLDRMWYVLTDTKGLKEEGFELGVSIQTLASQLESRGSEVLYLVQKGPKRLLGLTAYIYEPREEIMSAAKDMEKMGITIETAPYLNKESLGSTLRIPDDISVTLPELVPLLQAAKELP